MKKKKKIVVEVCSRGEQMGYHACLKGDTGIWGHGTSVGKAVQSFIGTYHDELGLTTKDLQGAITLEKRIEMLFDRNIELDVRFLLTKLR